jgi:hypothetical protein
LLASDYSRIAVWRRFARRHDDSSAARLLQASGEGRTRRPSATCRCSQRIAGDAFAETLVIDVTAVGVGGEPLASQNVSLPVRWRQACRSHTHRGATVGAARWHRRARRPARAPSVQGCAAQPTAS